MSPEGLLIRAWFTNKVKLNQNELGHKLGNEIRANWLELKFKLIIIDLTLFMNRAQAPYSPMCPESYSPMCPESLLARLPYILVSPESLFIRSLVYISSWARLRWPLSKQIKSSCLLPQNVSFIHGHSQQRPLSPSVRSNQRPIETRQCPPEGAPPAGGATVVKTKWHTDCFSQTIIW